MTQPLDPIALFSALNDAGVDYVVIGGLAVIAHGVIRATKDVDVCPAPTRKNLELLAGMLRAVDAVQVGAGDFGPDEMPFDPTDPVDLAQGGNFRLETKLGALDIMQWIPGIGEDSAYPTLATEALVTAAEDVPIRVCSLAHLRAMKRTAGRHQDLQDLQDLAIAHGEDPASS